MLPESLGPRVKLGPLRSSEEVSSSFTRDEENLTSGNDASLAIEAPRICAVSARIWKQMVENSVWRRPSFKRAVEDLPEPPKCDEFDAMMKKMKLVKIVDDGCVCPEISLNADGSAEPSPAIPLN